MTDRLRAVPQTAKTPGSEAPTSATGGIRESFNAKYFEISRLSPLLQEDRGTANASACPFSAMHDVHPGPVTTSHAAPLRPLGVPGWLATAWARPDASFTFMSASARLRGGLA